MLKTAAVTTGGSGGNGTVTNVSTGTGLTGGPITTTGTVSLANTSVTAGTYGSNTGTVQILVDAQGRINSASTVDIVSLSNLALPNVTLTTGNANVTTLTLSANTTANATFSTPSLPLVPQGYIVVNLSGTPVKVPYYAV